MFHINKIITFVIPAYNSAATLCRCLDSFVHESMFPYMEVLIVDDGSTDDTAEIAMEYVNRYSVFFLVSKENGGHGSVINYAVEKINGKYFKVIDSDDWIVSDNLQIYVESLQKTNVDVVFTHFRTIDSRNGHTREYAMSEINWGQEHSFELFWKNRKTVSKVCSFHGITYNVSFYRKCNLLLSEGISYEDQEYATLPFAKVKTVLPLDIFLYEYSLGNPNQSVSDEQQIKNIAQMETVLWKVIDETPTTLNEIVYDYFLYKKREMLLSYYMVSLLKDPNKKRGRADAKILSSRIKKSRPDLYAVSRRQYAICSILSYCGVTGAKIAKMRTYPLYKFMTRFIH